MSSTETLSNEVANEATQSTAETLTMAIASPRIDLVMPIEVLKSEISQAPSIPTIEIDENEAEYLRSVASEKSYERTSYVGQALEDPTPRTRKNRRHRRERILANDGGFVSADWNDNNDDEAEESTAADETEKLVEPDVDTATTPDALTILTDNISVTPVDSFSHRRESKLLSSTPLAKFDSIVNTFSMQTSPFSQMFQQQYHSQPASPVSSPAPSPTPEVEPQTIPERTPQLPELPRRRPSLMLASRRAVSAIPPSPEPILPPPKIVNQTTMMVDADLKMQADKHQRERNKTQFEDLYAHVLCTIAICIHVKFI